VSSARWSGLRSSHPATMFLESFFQLAAPTVRAEPHRGPVRGARPLRLRRLMSPGVVAAVLADPGRIWAEYTNSPVRGHKTCTDRPGVLGRVNLEITYSDIPARLGTRDQEVGVPEHLTGISWRWRVAPGGSYDRLADGVTADGRPAISVREFVSLHADEFGGSSIVRSAVPNNTLQRPGPTQRLSRVVVSASGPAAEPRRRQYSKRGSHKWILDHWCAVRDGNTQRCWTNSACYQLAKRRMFPNRSFRLPSSTRDGESLVTTSTTVRFSGPRTLCHFE